MISIKQYGEYRRFQKWLKKLEKTDVEFTKYAEEGLAALKAHTPKDTGLTAASWYYEIVDTEKGKTIEYHNDNLNGGLSIALLIFYGHGTNSGVYVQGIDYINPALQEVFFKLQKDIAKEVFRE